MCLMRGSAVAPAPWVSPAPRRTPIDDAAALPAIIESHARRPKDAMALLPPSTDERLSAARRRAVWPHCGGPVTPVKSKGSLGDSPSAGASARLDVDHHASRLAPPP